MHKVWIPDDIVARTRLQRGGREHLFETLDMARVAHVIVDLQVGFVAEGAAVEVPVTREMIGEVNAISKAVRDAGGINAFLRFTHDPDEPVKWTSNYTGYMTAPMIEMVKQAFSRGAKDWELYPALDVQPGDLIFDKTRYSGFIPGTCLMHEQLQALGIDTLIITGTLTNCCCESTAGAPVKVAYLFPSSGPAGIWAPACQAAAAVAAAEINAAGGILGEEVELLFGDSGLTERQATAALETLIELDGAQAVIGAHTSNIRNAVSRRLAGRLPYVYTAQYEGVPCGPSTVAIGSTDDELLAPGLHWLINEKSAQRFFFVGNDYIWPRMALNSAKRLIKHYNRELVGQVFMPIGRMEHDQVLQQIAVAQPDVVVVVLVGNCGITFNRAFARAGLDEKALRLALVADETVIHGVGADGTNNLYTVSNYFADRRSRSNDRFLELYHDAFGSLAPPVSAGSVGCYEGLHVLAGLARDQGTTDSVVLSNVLRRSMSREAARHSLFATPVGQHPQVHIAAAEGLSLRVISSIASH